jgi:hypothetical protein
VTASPVPRPPHNTGRDPHPDTHISGGVWDVSARLTCPIISDRRVCRRVAEVPLVDTLVRFGMAAALPHASAMISKFHRRVGPVVPLGSESAQLETEMSSSPNGGPGRAGN